MGLEILSIPNILISSCNVNELKLKNENLHETPTHSQTIYNINNNANKKPYISITQKASAELSYEHSEKHNYIETHEPEEYIDTENINPNKGINIIKNINHAYKNPDSILGKRKITCFNLNETKNVDNVIRNGSNDINLLNVQSNTISNSKRIKLRPKNGFSHTDSELLNKVIHYSKVYIGSTLLEKDIKDLVRKSFENADLNYGFEEAAKWGMEVFPDDIPPSKINEHVDLLSKHNGDFRAMAKERLESILPTRLNYNRISGLQENNPERDLLFKLADGMHVFLDPNFTPNGSSAETRPPLREKYKQTHLAVNFTLYKLVMGGLAFLLPMAVAQKIPGIHFSPAHWAPKKGKKQGRPIIDSTDSSSLRPVLNTPSVKLMADDACGVIKHPTLSDIVNTFLTLKDAHPDKDWSHFEAWKMDLKGAFTLMSYPSESCPLFSMELMDNIAVIFLCGLFGWSATPAYFQIITRAIVFELKFRLLCVLMYVDDIMGLSLKSDGEHHRNITKSVCCDLLGINAIEDDKTEVTDELNPSIDMIGYKLNLSTQTVSISERNALRALYAFFSIDEERKVPVRALEIMASLASRYAEICPTLRPFVRALYSAYAGLSRNVSVVLNIEAKRAIHMWRAMLCTLTIKEKEFARPYYTFKPRTSKWVIQFDASLTGIGILLWKRGDDKAEMVVGAAGTSIESY